jgi:hypothetical protein
MKIRPVGAELFHADGQAGRQTWTRLKKGHIDGIEAYKYLRQAISHALGTILCDKRCGRVGGRGAWYWRNSADTR